MSQNEKYYKMCRKKSKILKCSSKNSTRNIIYLIIKICVQTKICMKKLRKCKTQENRNQSWYTGGGS